MFQSDTCLLSLPVSWGHQTQWEYYIRSPLVERNSYAAIRRSPHVNSLTCQMSGITAGVCLIIVSHLSVSLTLQSLSVAICFTRFNNIGSLNSGHRGYLFGLYGSQNKALIFLYIINWFVRAESVCLNQDNFCPLSEDNPSYPLSNITHLSIVASPYTSVSRSPDFDVIFRLEARDIRRGCVWRLR